MDETQSRSDKRPDFAVVRSYAPARIEQELLAHVLALVVPGIAIERLQSADMFQRNIVTASTGRASELAEVQSRTLVLEGAT